MSIKRLLLFCLLIGWGCTDNAPTDPSLLIDLNIEGAKTSLNPSFDPDVFRYSVIGGDGLEQIFVTAIASPSALISIDGRLTSSGATEPISNLVPGDVVRIEVTRRSPVDVPPVVYEIVYLPADFPELNVTLLKDGVSPDPLYVNLNGPLSNYVAILDNNGVPSFYRRESERVFDFKWHAATGERSYARLTGTRNQWGRRNSEQIVLDSEFNEIAQITTVGLSHTDNHDFLIEPNDELIVMSYDGRIRDLTAFGMSAEEVVEDSVIQVLDRKTRQVLFEWNSWGQILYEDQTYPDTRGEYAHVNSIFVDSDGHIILSARGTSQVVKISRPGGQVLWKLGGKSNQFEFANDPYANLCGQHTASRLENGNLLIFDNGQFCWPDIPERGELTRVVEYRIDEQSLVAELVWSYSREDTYTLSQGSAQRLSNGNTLIGWGRGPGVLATEVDEDGAKVFEIVALADGRPVITYRARRYPE